MRAKQFIFEYNQAKTAEVFGDKLIAALLADKGSFPTMTMAHQRTLLLSPDMKDIPLDQQTREYILTAILKSMEAADPTPNKSYVPWLVRCYANEGIKLEDIMSRGKDRLEYYDMLKRRKIVPGTSREANIMNLKFADLWNVVNNPEHIAKAQAAEQATMPKGESTVFLNNDTVRIIVPLDMAAAMYYGQGTQWCTAARNHNMFDRYNKDGKMYIFLPKQPQYEGEKYQIHPVSGQFMNEQDEPIDAYHFLTTRFGNLVQFFKWNEPKITRMLVFADDDVLKKAIQGILEISYEYINEKFDDWRDNDEYYDEWLREEGYVIDERKVEIAADRAKITNSKPEFTEDDLGTIDWYAAPDYFQYNSDAKDEYDRLVGLVDVSPKEVKGSCADYMRDGDFDNPSLKVLDDVIAYMIDQDRHYHDANEDFAEWIQRNVAVDEYGQVTRVSLSRTGRVTPR